MEKITKSWMSSVKPGKQRKWLIHAPLHKRNTFMSAMLSKQLREKLHTRNVPVRKGDKVKILRGQFTDKIGAVTSVDTKEYRVYIESVETVRKNGAKVPYAIHPSKVMIIEMHEDKKRLKRIGKQNQQKANPQKEKKQLKAVKENQEK